MDAVHVPACAPGRAIRFTVALRHTLRSEHERLEGRLGLPGSIGGHADYARLLSLWSIVWEGVAATADPATVPGSELAVLAGDALAALARDCGELEPGAHPPAITVELPADEASLWGAAYVLRGSSLGNRFLHPLILGRLGGSGCVLGLHYLAGGGPDVRRDWSAFCRRLDHWAECASEPDRDRAADSAAATFRVVGTVAEALGWPAGDVVAPSTHVVPTSRDVATRRAGPARRTPRPA